jgi:hypothetical protein
VPLIATSRPHKLVGSRQLTGCCLPFARRLGTLTALYSFLISSTVTSVPTLTLPKKLTRGSWAMRVNWLVTFCRRMQAQHCQQLC